MLGHVEDRVEVGSDDGIPSRLGHFPERRILCDTGVVNKDVDAIKGIEGSRQHIMDIETLTHIHMNEQDLAVALLK